METPLLLIGLGLVLFTLLWISAHPVPDYSPRREEYTTAIQDTRDELQMVTRKVDSIVADTETYVAYGNGRMMVDNGKTTGGFTGSGGSISVDGKEVS